MILRNGIAICSLLITIGCASQYRADTVIQIDSQTTALAILDGVFRPADENGGICSAGLGFRSERLVDVSMSDTTVILDTRHATSSLNVIKADTISGSQTAGLSEVVEDRRQIVNLRDLDKVRYVQRPAGGDCIQYRHRQTIIIETPDKYVVSIAPPSHEVPKILAAIRFLSPEARIIEGYGY